MCSQGADVPSWAVKEGSSAGIPTGYNASITPGPASTHLRVLLFMNPCCRPTQHPFYDQTLPRVALRGTLNKTLHWQSDTVPCCATALAPAQLIALDIRRLWLELSQLLPSFYERCFRPSADFVFIRECLLKCFKWLLQNFRVDCLYSSPHKVGHV